MLLNGIADGLCIVDFTQTTTPSHVRLFDVLTAAAVMQAQCVESITPTCTSLPHSVAMQLLEDLICSGNRSI